MNKNSKIVFSLIINLSIIIMEFFAINHPYVSGDGWKLFEMYTQDSNILLFLCSTLYVIFAIISICKKIEFPKFVKILRYTSTCCITLTLILIRINAYIIMKPIDFASLYTWPMLAMHTICPVLSITSFFWLEEKFEISFKQTFIALIPTIIYACVLIPLNICKVIEGPYFFFEVYNRPVYMSIIYFCVIILSAYTICVLYKLIYDRILKRK